MNSASFGFFAAAAYRQRMIGRNRHELGAEQRVGPRRENLQLAFAGRCRRLVEREANQQTLAASDPVALHQPHLVGPAVQRIERVQQFLRVLRDLEDPLIHLALFDDGARTPAAAVDHLLVGEHRHVDRVPVDLALLALGEAGAQEVVEHFLLVPVVGGIAGGELADQSSDRPIERNCFFIAAMLS